MSNIGLIGYYSLEQELVNGQTIKSKLVYDALKSSLGNDKIIICDYSNWRKRPVAIMLEVIRLFKTCKHIIIFPARNALRALAPLLCILNKLFKRGIHYYVVGGWLIEEIKNNNKLIEYLKKFDYIYVELNKMKEELQGYGLNNVVIVNKFRDIQILKPEELNYSSDTPHKLCIFSRIMKEKGIGEAIDAVEKINHAAGKELFSLDIYGQVYQGYEEWFDNLKKSFPSYIRYCGFIDYKTSNRVLKEYFALLFPTYYYGEGYPNTVVDAFAAGLPVIGTDWNYNNEVIHNGVDGILYDPKKPDELRIILETISKDPGTIIDMKKHALERAKEYIPNIAIQPLLDKLE